MALPITAFYAGILALWMLFLAFRVVGFRRTHRVSLGDGGHDAGISVIRGHANAAETIPIFLILQGLAEGMGTPGWTLHVLGLAFLTGRVLHGVHFLRPRKGFLLRFWGMILTVLATALTALGLIGHALVKF